MSIEELERKQSDLQSQLNEIKRLMEQTEAQLLCVYTEIQRYKIAQSSCQEHFADDEVDLKITQEETFQEGYEKTLDTEAPPVILPKPLTIKGYEKVEDFLWRHIKDTIPDAYNDQYKYFHSVLYGVARSLSIIGKEIIFEKIEPINDEDTLKEWREIIETCRKIYQYKKNNDKQGYVKILNFFYQKYPKPNNPFNGTTPVDLFTQAMSPYTDAYYLKYYLLAFQESVAEYNNKFWRESERVTQVQNTDIDDFFIKLMEMFYMLSVKHRKLAVVPILDENIIYRPKRVAKDGNYFSLYYYDDYVEDPQMVTEGNANPSNTAYYFSGGSTYVNGHYRSGYWRNGRYVSGGYVKGHYRS